MNLHGSFVKNHMHFGDEESIDLTSTYFYVVLYHALRASNLIATERGETFDTFWESKYASGEFFEQYVNPQFTFGPQTAKVKGIVEEQGIYIPTTADWVELAKLVAKHGLYNSHLMAIPPTGSISYINNSTPSTIPATFSLLEKRSEGKLGTVYCPNSYAEGNEEYYAGTNMFEIDSKKVIDVNSAIQFFVDQSISLTLGYKSSVTTKDVTKNILYAFSKGKPSAKALDERGEMLARYPQANIKSLYYVRVHNVGLEGTQDETCVSCSL
jgi:ribonucleoside-diphosphate reductase alpha chain